MKKRLYVFISLFLPNVSYASYFGGEEMLQYFLVVLLLGFVFSVFLSIERDQDGAMKSFKIGKFVLMLVTSCVAAIIAGFIGLEVGGR